MCAGGLSKHLIDSIKFSKVVGEFNLTCHPLSPFAPNASSSTFVTAVDQ